MLAKWELLVLANFVDIYSRDIGQIVKSLVDLGIGQRWRLGLFLIVFVFFCSSFEHA